LAHCFSARDALDTVFVGNPAHPKAGYLISRRIFGLTTIPIFGKISNRFINKLEQTHSNIQLNMMKQLN
jgi:hypothetical protein